MFELLFDKLSCIIRLYDLCAESVVILEIVNCLKWNHVYYKT